MIGEPTGEPIDDKRESWLSDPRTPGIAGGIIAAALSLVVTYTDEVGYFNLQKPSPWQYWTSPGLVAFVRVAVGVVLGVVVGSFPRCNRRMAFWIVFAVATALFVVTGPIFYAGRYRE